MLALGTTPAIAQTAPDSTTTASPDAPIVLQMPVQPGTQTPPPVVLPTAAPTQQPIVIDVPEAPAPDATTTPVVTQKAEAAPKAKPAPKASAPVKSTAGSAPVAAPIDTATDAAAPLAMPTAEPAIPMADPAAVAERTQPAPVEGNGPDWLAIALLALAGLIPIGLAIYLFTLFRRRSRVVQTPRAEATYVERPEPTPVPVVERAPITSNEDRGPAYVAPTIFQPSFPDRVTIDNADGLPNEGAAVALPAEMPESFEERDALLRRMIAAEPDKANPFRSAKARARRARLIMQSLGRRFENAKPRMDLSQYTSNWPALARRRTGYA